MEWTPEALRAEIDYRQKALRADAQHVRVFRTGTSPKRSWWRRLGHRPDVPEQHKGRRNAA